MLHRSSGPGGIETKVILLLSFRDVIRFLFNALWVMYSSLNKCELLCVLSGSWDIYFGRNS